MPTDPEAVQCVCVWANINKRVLQVCGCLGTSTQLKLCFAVAYDAGKMGENTRAS